MPTSDDSLARRVAVRLLQALACIAVLAGANYLMTLALEPYGSSTEVVWWAYREAADEEIDTVFCGTSFAQAGFNPKAFDEGCGSHSWTLATSAQPLENSERAIRTAARDHHIKRAILGIGFSTLHDKPYINSTATFVQAMSVGRPLSEGIANYWDLITSKSFFAKSGSISGLFPWSFSNVGYNPEAIGANIRNRMELATPLEAGETWQPGWVYGGQGYYFVSGFVDLDRAGNATTPATKEQATFHEPNLETLASIARTCNEMGIELYVVATPMPAFTIMRMGKAYPRQMERARKIVEDAGGRFLDFNMAQEQLYEINYRQFNDSDHLNEAGAASFSQTLGQLISRIEAGEDVSDEFFGYDEWDAWKRSLDHISVIGASGTPTGAGISVDVWAWADPEIDVEYQLSRLDDEGNAIEVVVPWSGETSFELPAEGHGTYHLRVDARRADKPDEIERTSLLDVLY